MSARHESEGVYLYLGPTLETPWTDNRYSMAIPSDEQQEMCHTTYRSGWSRLQSLGHVDLEAGKNFLQIGKGRKALFS